jgi:cation transporter-like permease
MKRGNGEFHGPGRFQGRSVLGALGWFVGALVWAAAAAIGAVMAVVIAATMVAIALMASVPLVLSVAVLRARRSVRAAADPDLLEARHVGGHSWVAYAGNARR